MKLCADCFKDEEIRQFINSTSNEIEVCEFCSKPSTSIDFVELADFFMSMISIYTPDRNGLPLYQFLQKDWQLFDGSINSIQKILNQILSHISLPYTANTKVKYIDEINECIGYWEILKEELKLRKRFLSDITDYGWDTLFDVNSIIDRQIPLYRSRVHHDENDNKPYPIEKMGCPNNSLSEGRANPKGIKYLYLSKEEDTTFYETRSLYLDYVSIGTFHVKDGIAPLKITDFTKKLSPFNNITNIVEFTKGVLLRSIISNDLSKPLMRFDSDLEYIPTQFICEFIRYIYGTDGVQFNSSLKKGGINLVLFDEQKVECIHTELYQINKLKISGKKLRVH